MLRSVFFFVILAAVLLHAGLLSSCGSKKNPEEVKPIPSEFYGEWQGQDGSRLQIFANGKGNFKTGGKTVDGGTVEYMPNSKSFEISLFGIGETFRIDQAPTASSSEMKLNGIVFRRVGGFAPESMSSRATTPSVPSMAELENLTYKSLTNFGNAVMMGDFTLFHSRLAPEFQRDFTPEKLKAAFAEFVERKVDVGMLVQNSPITFSTPASIDGNGILKTQGTIASKIAPVTVLFSLDYVFRDNEWKLIGLDIRAKDTSSP